MGDDMEYMTLKKEFYRWNGDAPSAAALLFINEASEIRVLAVNKVFNELIMSGPAKRAEGRIEDALGNSALLRSAFDRDETVEWDWTCDAAGHYMKCRCKRIRADVVEVWATENAVDTAGRKAAGVNEQRAHELIEKILATTQTAIFWKDADRRFLGANRAFLNYYDFQSVDAIIGRTDEDMGWHTDPDPYKNDEIQVIQNGISTKRVPGKCMSHGENRDIVASKTPLYENGKIAGLVGSFEDVTNEVRQREQIEKLNEQLERSLEAEKTANMAKSDFMARISHDMRTPLTTVIGLCDIAAGKYDDAVLLKYFENIKESSEYLLSILNDILDMQNLMKGHMEVNPVICTGAETAETINMIIRPMAEAKNIEFITDFRCKGLKCYPKADIKKVQQIILNILTNAVKYTQSGGRISWTVDIVEESPSRLVAVHTISDNGPGMSSEFQKVMYEPFTQEKTVANVDGSGLGLAIVKKMTELVGGTVSCSSARGAGTSFTVTIPHEIAQEDEIKAYLDGRETHREYRSLKGAEILICEDNKINAEIIAELLSSKGVLTDHACNGEEAVRMSDEKRYDTILMDIRMPVMDGYEAAEKIRAGGSNVPIIALSANNFPEDIEKSKACGMNAHVAKPINTAELYKVLEKAVSGVKEG
jgi:signal transduction histidine kinase/ActR/RegA family two-component response regulator